MNYETGIPISLALFLIPVGLFARAAHQYFAERGEIREREVRDERRRRETEIEHAIARRRQDGERASPTMTPDAPGA